MQNFKNICVSQDVIRQKENKLFNKQRRKGILIWNKKLLGINMDRKISFESD